nr:hypothetical protein OG409_26835 [Streptomyces sp. NBC_00974]
MAGVPPRVTDLVMRLLAKDREDRPRDAAAVVAELRAALGGYRAPTAVTREATSKAVQALADALFEETAEQEHTQDHAR